MRGASLDFPFATRSFKKLYFLRKTIDFQYGALRGWTPDSSKSSYFLRKAVDCQYCALHGGTPDSSKSMYFLRKTKGLGNGKPREVREHLGPPLLRIEVEAAAIEKNSRKHIVLITFGVPACSGAFGCPGGTLGGFGSGGRSHREKQSKTYRFDHF